MRVRLLHNVTRPLGRLRTCPAVQRLINWVGLWNWRCGIWRRRVAGTLSSQAEAMIWVDPLSIESQIPVGGLPLDVEAIRDVIGWILDGDWDLDPSPLGQHPVIVGIHERFGEGREWRDTTLYRAAAEGLKEGRPLWKFRTASDIPRLFSKIDALYAVIARDGYRTQESLGTHRLWDELLVAVDRHGRIHLIDGAHRLAIAQALGVPAVPALVGVSHRLWEEDRRSAAAIGDSGGVAKPERNEERSVIFVSGVSGHGGPNASLRVLLPRLEAVRPILVGPYDASERKEWAAVGVLVEWMPRPRGVQGLGRAMCRLFTILWKRRRGHTAVFANGLTELAVLTPVLLLFRLQVAVWVHNFIPPRVALALAPLVRRLPRSRLRVAAVSQVASDVGRAVLGEGAEIVLIPNPIERPAMMARMAERKDGERLRVAYVAGTDRRYKGFDLLPDIIAAADSCGLKWLVVAVESTQPAAWRRLRKVVNGLKDSTVTIRGRTNRVEELYSWADIVLIPSRQESFCRVAAEAMAAGVGVVTARLPAIEEVCDDAAFYFEPEDPQGAARLLCDLSRAPEVLHQSRLRGTERVGRFSPPRVAAQWNELLRSLKTTSADS